ncbi:MAG: hypothetical protein L0Z62_40465 [Gemmataceae bacterium]|nr:hypothetical protein [Gemmataceae bacterium]
MQSQFDVTSFTPAKPPAAADSSESTLAVADLLRQILDVQRQQLAQLQATAAAHDTSARWRALLGRWREHFPELPELCRGALPILERAYGQIVHTLVEELEQNPDALDTEFALQDFLDRYGLRLGQIGNIINLVGPLAEAGQQSEPS